MAPPAEARDGVPAVPIRPASTVMVVRDGAQAQAPLEVLMVRRTLAAEFAGGAYVFPGGTVDPTDGGPDACVVCSGRDDAAASDALGIGSGGLAYWVAAVRECFEEAGLLLATRRRDGSQVSFADPDEAARFARHRRDVNAGRRRFLDVVAEEDLELSVGLIEYFAHWITPEGAPRRFDTRFFVAPAPPDQTPAHDAGETIADVWLRPAEAIELHRRGEIELVLPTIRTLQAIGRFSSASALLDATARTGSVPSILPRVVQGDDGLRIVLPGEPGYSVASWTPPPAEVYEAATRSASRAAVAEIAGTPVDPVASGSMPTRVRMPVAVPDSGIGPAPAPGRPARLLPGLLRVTAPNPGMMTGPGTNTYVVGAGSEVAVVDPGPDDPDHRDALVGAAESAGARIRWVLVTHTHPDHAPGAAALAARSGAELIGFDARDGFVPDRPVPNGWVLDGPDFRLRAVHTPGHASNHLCWLLEGEGVVLSGDHVMHGATVVIRPPDGDMTAYLESLRLLADMGPELKMIAPGHGRLIGDPARTLSGIMAHRLEREEVVADALASARRATVDELVARVYEDVNPVLLPVARFSLWAHLRKLAADGRATARLPAATSGDGGEPTLGTAPLALDAPSGPTILPGPDHPELAAVWEPA